MAGIASLTPDPPPVIEHNTVMSGEYPCTKVCAHGFPVIAEAAKNLEGAQRPKRISTKSAPSSTPLQVDPTNGKKSLQKPGD